jgi:hypothetical protein
MRPFEVFRNVSADPDVPAVGGPLQLGVFKNDQFKIVGVQTYEVDESSKIVTTSNIHRGIDWAAFLARLGMPEANFAVTIARVFDCEIDALVDRGFIVRTAA